MFLARENTLAELNPGIDPLSLGMNLAKEETLTDLQIATPAPSPLEEANCSPASLVELDAPGTPTRVGTFFYYLYQY